MKKKWMWLTAIILLVTFPITACSSGKDVAAEAYNDQTEIVVIESEEVPKGAALNNSVITGKIDNLTEYTEAWTELYSVHESTINAYTGMPIMSLVMVGMPLANAIFYSLLNLDNVDGNFSGKIGFSDAEGYYNKSGDFMEFGQDNIRAEDGFVPNDLAGDRILTEGSFDASKGYFIMDDSTMRNDQVILRTKTEFIRSEDGAFVCLYQVAGDMEQSGNANKYNLLTFIFMSETQYEFVNAEGTIGVDGKILKLTEGMTVEEATQLFLDSGYTISETGGIEDGVFVVK